MGAGDAEDKPVAAVTTPAKINDAGDAVPLKTINGAADRGRSTDKLVKPIPTEASPGEATPSAAIVGSNPLADK